MEKKYDAIIVGAGIAGLGVSGLLAKAGKRVLLLEKNRNVGGRAATFKKDGVVRSIGQHAALRDMKLDQLFERLGVQGPEREYFSDLVMYYEGEFKSIAEIFPLVPVLAGEDAMRMMEVVTGEVNLEELDDLPADQWVKRFTTNEFLINLIRMGSLIMTTIPRLEEMAASTVYETSRALMGSMLTWLAADGMSSFLNAMAERVVAMGGTVMTNATVRSILVEKGKVKGVLFEENIAEEVEGEFGSVVRVEAPLVVSAVPIWEIFKMIPEEKFPRSFVKQARNVSLRTANLGITALLNKPPYEGKALRMVDYPSVGYPGTVFMPTSVCPRLAPEGKHLFEASIICDYEPIAGDQAKKHHMLEMLKQDLRTWFPGWEEEALWVSSYFHYEEPKRTPGRAGKHRPGNKAPRIKGLYFCGDSVASRALPGMECAADSATMCAREILGELP